MSALNPGLLLARRLHAGQVDKGGKPYIEHLGAVVGILLRQWPDAPEHVVEAAWLHDAIEDTCFTAIGLISEGASSAAVYLVSQLTRPIELPYLDWIGVLAAKGDPWAIRIKLADNEHNSDPERALPGSDMVERRYRPAREILLNALSTRGVN